MCYFTNPSHISIYNQLDCSGLHPPTFTHTHTHTHNNTGLVQPTRGKGAVVRHGLLAETKGPLWQPSREKAALLLGINKLLSRELLIRILQLLQASAAEAYVPVQVRVHA